MPENNYPGLSVRERELLVGPQRMETIPGDPYWTWELKPRREVVRRIIEIDDALKAALAVSKQAIKAADERCLIVLSAKDHWANRARLAERKLARVMEAVRVFFMEWDDQHDEDIAVAPEVFSAVSKLRFDTGYGQERRAADIAAMDNEEPGLNYDPCPDKTLILKGGDIPSNANGKTSAGLTPRKNSSLTADETENPKAGRGPAIPPKPSKQEAGVDHEAAHLTAIHLIQNRDSGQRHFLSYKGKYDLARAYIEIAERIADLEGLDEFTNAEAQMYCDDVRRLQAELAALKEKVAHAAHIVQREDGSFFPSRLKCVTEEQLLLCRRIGGACLFKETTDA